MKAGVSLSGGGQPGGGPAQRRGSSLGGGGGEFLGWMLVQPTGGGTWSEGGSSLERRGSSLGCALPQRPREGVRPGGGGVFHNNTKRTP